MLNQFERSLNLKGIKNLTKAKPIFFTDHDLIKHTKDKHSIKNNRSLFRNKQSRNDNSVYSLSKPLSSKNIYSKNTNLPNKSTKNLRELDLSGREKMHKPEYTNPQSFRGSKKFTSPIMNEIETQNSYFPQTTCSDKEICTTKENMKEIGPLIKNSNTFSYVNKDRLTTKKNDFYLKGEIFSEKLMKNLKLNDDYDIMYNQQASPEEQDKVDLDDLKTYKFKQAVKNCLKRELVDSFKLDEFYNKLDNKVNFIHDNYLVPHFRSKLYVTSSSKV